MPVLPALLLTALLSPAPPAPGGVVAEATTARPALVYVPASHLTRSDRPDIDGFALMQTEVTRAQWRAVMGVDMPWPPGSDDTPATAIDWYTVLRFANKLSQQEGRSVCYDLPVSAVGWPGVSISCTGYRLPTEVEWDFAASAGTRVLRRRGLDDVAWHAGNSGSTLHPVGQKQANAWGLYDMLGNASEWTWTQPASELNFLTGLRAVRGGSHLTRSTRLHQTRPTRPERAPADVGLRLLRAFP